MLKLCEEAGKSQIDSEKNMADKAVTKR